MIAPAPEFQGTQQWFNTPGDRPLTMAELRGRVVLIDFWTYTCINCIRTQPWLNAMYDRYADKGLTIIGVHTPEFPFERDAGNVEDAIERAGIKYPVVQDNDYAVWNSYANQYWPAKYFIDADGQVRFAHFGEGEYEQSEEVIRELLADAGRRPGAGMTGASGIKVNYAALTPESYLGTTRADRFENGILLPGVRDFGALEEAEAGLAGLRGPLEPRSRRGDVGGRRGRRQLQGKARFPGPFLPRRSPHRFDQAGRQAGPGGGCRSGRQGRPGHGQGGTAI